MDRKRSNIYWSIYYLVLLLVFARGQGTSAPSLILRMAFISAAFLPSILTKRISYPAILTLFLTITLYGFSYSFMPYTLSLYVLITIPITLIFVFQNNSTEKPPVFLAVFALYIFIVDSITGFHNTIAHFPEDSVYCFLLLICFLLITSGIKTTAHEQLSLAFLAITIVLSLFFLLNRETFSVAYDYGQQYERSGWTDPNYFGTVVGMGLVEALMVLFKRDGKKSSLWLTIMAIFALVVATPVLLLNASRGALLSVMVSGGVIFMFTRVKASYKVFALIVVFIALIVLYNNQYMDLLAYRIENDASGGSGRLSIWSSKLDAFFNGGILHVLFGYGYAGGLSVSGYFIGFHNDFIAFLVDYGLVGLFFFLAFLWYPIAKTSRKSKDFPAVLSIIAYLFITGLTLEPFNGGRFPYYAFYMQALLIVSASKSYYPANNQNRNDDQGVCIKG